MGRELGSTVPQAPAQMERVATALTCPRERSNWVAGRVWSTGTASASGPGWKEGPVTATSPPRPNWPSLSVRGPPSTSLKTEATQMVASPGPTAVKPA